VDNIITGINVIPSRQITYDAFDATIAVFVYCRAADVASLRAADIYALMFRYDAIAAIDAGCRDTPRADDAAAAMPLRLFR